MLIPANLSLPPLAGAVPVGAGALLALVADALVGAALVAAPGMHWE